MSRLLKRRSGEQGSTPQPHHALGSASSLLGDRSESRARSYAVLPGSGNRPSRFLGRETLEKPDNLLIIAGQLREWKGPRGLCARIAARYGPHNAPGSEHHLPPPQSQGSGPGEATAAVAPSPAPHAPDSAPASASGPRPSCQIGPKDTWPGAASVRWSPIIAISNSRIRSPATALLSLSFASMKSPHTRRHSTISGVASPYTCSSPSSGSRVTSAGCRRRS